MAWVAVDQNGEEWVHSIEPARGNECWFSPDYIELPSGTIKKLTGRDLTWDDEPVELK